ncbi:MAG: amino acid adenylation domain-containing protein [Crocinitomix sp.]|jgi:amino acid adenylation domain-containing protein/non-ribosomal peptide synthase protein (TIGR01720 family)
MSNRQEEIFELSYNQKRFWFLNQDNFQKLYTQISVKISGEISVDKLETFINQITNTHETLSSKITRDENSIFPSQIPTHFQRATIEFISIDNYKSWLDKQEEEANDFDIETASPIQFFLFHDDQKKANKLVFKGYSFWIDLYGCYTIVDQLNQLMSGGTIISPEDEAFIVHRNFAAWQNELINEEEGEGVSYWSNRSFDLNRSIIPFGGNSTPDFNAKKINLGEINGKQFTELSESLANRKLDQELLFLSGLIGFARNYEDKEITFAYHMFGRSYDVLNNTVGLISKMLPLKIEDNFDFEDKSTRKKLLNGIEKTKEWSDYFGDSSFTTHAEKLKYKICFQYVDATIPFSDKDIPSQIIEDVFSVEESFELKLLVYNYGNRFELDLYYNSKVYSELEITVIKDQLNEALEAVISTDYFSTRPSSTIPEILEQLNSFEENDIDLDQSVLDLIQNQVNLHPKSVAIQTDLEEITYEMLWEKSNNLANKLITKYGALNGQSIAVLLDDSTANIVSVLGVLKTGAFFVPIDASHPTARINYVLSDCACVTLISEKKFEAQLDFANDFLLYSELSAISTPSKSVPAISAEKAYVIYTSGSTGKPKGVIVSHRSLTNYITWAKQYYLENETIGNTGLFTSFAFDLTLTSIFIPLVNGKTIFAQKESLSVDEKLVSILENPTIDLVKLTPSHISLLSALEFKLGGNKAFICGGEKLTIKQTKALFDLGPAIKVYNEYGPTEATVGCIVKEIKADDQLITIGKPISNTKIKVINANGNSSIGAKGEILIGGHCLALGYLNREKETKEAFVQIGENSTDRYYKTGDLGRVLPNGELEYLGRIDDQVKIKGYRIELGEIEQALLQNKALNEAIVVVKENSEEEKNLVAFVTSDVKQNSNVLRSFLAEILPAYMLPTYYVQLSEFPLTNNGKVDKKALLQMNSISMLDKVEYIAPETIEEQVLAEVWGDVLKSDEIGLKDNFINRGGDSIKAIQVVARIRQKGYSLKVEQVLTTPLLKEMSLLMELKIGNIDQSEVAGNVSLTPIQTWFFNSDEIKKHHHFNQSVLLKTEEKIDSELLEKSLTALTTHHDALRMVYKQVDGNWQQINQAANANTFTVDYYDLSQSEDAASEVMTIGKELQSKIALNDGPLFKVIHYRMKDGDRLGLILHHLVVDGISWRIILADLSDLYKAIQANEKSKLPLKTDAFQKWAKAQNEYALGTSLDNERKYWEVLINQNIPKLPQDIVGNDAVIMDAVESIQLDKELTTILQTQVHQVYNTEINDLLLTSLGLAIKDVFGVNKSVLKMEAHGREHIFENLDVSRTVGWFTAEYPFILDVTETGNKTESLIRIKETLRSIPNKGIGYGMINYLSNTAFEKQLQPEIVFNYLGDFGTNLTAKDDALFQFDAKQLEGNIAVENRSDGLLNVSGMIVNGEFNLSIGYSKAQFHESRIQQLIQAYEGHLKQLLNELSQSAVTYLTPSDLSYKGLSVEELAQLNSENNLEDVYELSPLQEGIYFHWLSDDANSLYFEQTAYRIKANAIPFEKMQCAFDKLVARHAVLRTAFSKEFAGRSLQIVSKTVKSNFTFEKTEGALSIVDKQSYIDSVREKDRNRGFDLASPSQMRLHVVELSKGEYEFIWSHHHILMDGWCVAVLNNDFNQFLQAEVNEAEANLAPVLPYSNYINWLKSVDQNSTAEYWGNYLAEYSSVAEIPFKVKAENNTYQEGKDSLRIAGDLFKKIDTLCGQNGITQNTFVQTVWGFLLSRYNNKNDVVFGAVVSGRPAELAGVEDMIGLFINTIPVRVKYGADDTVLELLRKLQQQAVNSTAHHYLSLSEVQGLSELGMNLINHIMIFENYAVKEFTSNDQGNKQDEENLSIESMEVFERTNYDFNIMINPSDEELNINITYNENSYDPLLLKRLLKHFENLMREFAHNGDQSLVELNYLAEFEKEELLVTFNDTQLDYQKTKTVVDLFEEQVAKTPNNIALVFEDQELTFLELNNKSNQLANYFQHNYKIQPDETIGIQLARTEWMVITLLAVMKSGGAYVPIDPAHPQERVEIIIEDSKTKVLFNQAELDAFKKSQDEFSVNAESIQTKANNLAYVIYTSGSTGKPKGVLLEHRNVTNFFAGMTAIFGGDGGTFLAMTNYTFDISVLELVWTLTKGFKVVVQGDVKDLEAGEYSVYNQIKKHEVTHLQITPSMGALLNQNLSESDGWNSLNNVLLGGEPATTALVNGIYENMPQVQIYNMYGPTETTIWSTVNPIEKEADKIEIGRPIANTKIYILDQDQKMVPIGVQGEIYIGGDGVARGYTNSELTKQSFIENPFETGDRLYRTGDFGAWSTTGSIYCFGRIDQQVKIRGYRIEPGEVEQALAKMVDIEAVAVVAKENKFKEKELVAYITSNIEQNTGDLKAGLKAVLPDYMIPTFFVQLPELPLTGNGKVDKKALPNPEGLGLKSGVEYVAPRNEVEEKLIKIWENILEQKNIGIKDDFFALGGHSIKAMNIWQAIQSEFSIQINMKDVFVKSTIELIGEEVTRKIWIQKSIDEKTNSELQEESESDNNKNFII